MDNLSKVEKKELKRLKREFRQKFNQCMSEKSTTNMMRAYIAGRLNSSKNDDTVKTLRRTVDDLQKQNDKLIEENNKLIKENSKLAKTVEEQYLKMRNIKTALSQFFTDGTTCKTGDSSETDVDEEPSSVSVGKGIDPTTVAWAVKNAKTLNSINEKRDFVNGLLKLLGTNERLADRLSNGERSYTLVAYNKNFYVMDDLTYQFYGVGIKEFHTFRKTLAIKCKELWGMRGVDGVMLLRYDQKKSEDYTDKTEFAYTGVVFDISKDNTVLGKLLERIENLRWKDN